MIPDSKRLYYRKFTEASREDYFRLSMNEEVMRYITGRAATEVEASERFEKVLALGIPKTEAGMFEVHWKGKEGILGLAKWVYTQPHQVEIGYSLFPEFWGQGLGTEIAQTLVSYSKQFDHITELIGIIDPANTPSARILLGCGFKFWEEKEIYGLDGALYGRKL